MAAGAVLLTLSLKSNRTALTSTFIPSTDVDATVAALQASYPSDTSGLFTVTLTPLPNPEPEA
jgi:hypothetical protein